MIKFLSLLLLSLSVARADVYINKQPLDITNIGLVGSTGSGAMNINIKAKSLTDATGGNPVQIGFKSGSSTAVSYVKRILKNFSSITIPSGASIGHADGMNQYVWVYALDNAGTIEPAISGVVPFPDNSFQSTVAISSGSSSGSVLYSASARTNVAIRLIGRFLINEPTASAWTADPTETSIQPTPIFTATEPSSFSPSFTGLGTVTAIQIFQERVGKKLHLFGTANVGTTSGAVASLTIPSGLSIDTSTLTVGNTISNSGPLIGAYGQVGAADRAGYMTTATGTSKTLIYFGDRYATATVLVPGIANSIFGSSTQFSFDFYIPINGWSNFGP